MSLPWLEKYRPKTLDDVVGNEKTIAALKALAADGRMPHLILCGPPGSGKTTAIRCLAHHLLGHDEKDAPTASHTHPQASSGAAATSRALFLAENEADEHRYYSNNVLELNASDERGVGVVRDAITHFAAKKTTFNPAMPGRHKIIILDEADNLTAAAQQSLRRLMELHEHSTRFALACNDSTGLIDPLQSRCVVLRFQAVPDTQVAERVVFVANAENVAADESGIAALVYVAAGDLRIALNNMQTVFAAYGGVTHETVYSMFDTPRPQHITGILACCLEGRLDDALADMHKLTTKGYSALDIIASLFRVLRAIPARTAADEAAAAASSRSSTAATTASAIFPHEAQEDEQVLTEERQMLMIDAIGKFNMRALNGCGTTLQLHALLASMCVVAENTAN